MATPAQAAAATVGAGSLAAAGAYGITQAVSGTEEENTELQEDNSMPSDVVTFKAEDISAYSGKVLAVVSEEHLLKLVKATDENNKWWDWAFKNKYSNKANLVLESSFDNLKDFNALKSSCKSAYETDKAQYNKNNFLENIGAFCTSGREKLSTLKPRVTVYKSEDDVNSYANGLLGVESNKAKLIKTSIDNNEPTNYNDLWWDWAFKNLYGNSRGVTKSEPFDSVTSGYENTETNGLNNACDDGYKKPYFELTANNNSLLNQIKKFCAVENAELTLPGAGTPTYINDKVDSTSPYTTDKSLAKINDNKTKLVDPDSNQNWWVWTFDHYYPKSTDTAGKAKLRDPFENIQTAYSTTTSPTSLNQACKTAYGKTNTSFSDSVSDGKDKLIDLVKKFCTLNTESITLAAPTAVGG